MEMYPDAEADPCEVYFSDYHEFEGRMMPSRMEVRFGDEVFGQFKFSEIKLEKEETVAAKPGSESPPRGNESRKREKPKEEAQPHKETKA
jgi:hypothetical protein